MSGYFDKKKKQKLYEQWVDKSGLPPESVPIDVEPEDISDEPPVEHREALRPGIQGGVTFRLTVRHFLYLLLISIVLLIATASLATVLIMRSC